ncbi:MAG: hypothetical protein WCI31_11695 [Prolixibacteraceae bacterium]
MPIFEKLVPDVKTVKEVTIPTQAVATTPDATTPDAITTDVKNAPVSRLTDKERRSRYMHTENLSTPSISGMLSGKNSAGVTESKSNVLNPLHDLKGQTFDMAQLLHAWKDFADSVDAAQLKSALSVREPILVEESNIIYSLDNEVQKQRIILDLKPKLLAHLHEALHNEKIEVEFVVTENKDEILNKPYTNQEKFNVLAAKYPVLGIMKQRFGLDFE